jgi:pimeloyl-ACP methyl ester carboxylesterase
LPYSLSADRVGVRVEGCGPPIVLLHSSMSSKSQWRELIERLRDRYRLIAIDLLGYGDSAPPSSGAAYRLSDEVRLVESVLARELRPGEPFHLIGHSFGGVIALQLAARTQEWSVRSLSLFEPIVFHLLPSGDPGLALVEGAWREMVYRLNAGDACGSSACFVDYWSGSGAFAQLRDTQQLALATQVPKVLLEFGAVAEEACGAAAYRCIEVPTLLGVGRWSPEPARRLAAMLAYILPDVRRFEVAAGHMAPITHPALVNPLFERFIRAVESRERPPELRAWHAPIRNLAFGLLGSLLALLPPFAMRNSAQHHGGILSGAIYPLEESAWHDSPPGMPPGSRFAVISGDPLKEGPFVMRVRLPPGYMLPPYRRVNEEQLIVLSGAITVGTVRESGAAIARTLTSGSYASLAASELHFAHTMNGATVQILGTGPFERML